MSRTTDQQNGSTAEGSAQVRDLRFAGGLSVGLVVAILVAGALVAPVRDAADDSPAKVGDRSQTVRLPAERRAVKRDESASRGGARRPPHPLPA